MSERPNLEWMMLVSWMIQSPSSIPEIEARMKYPEGFWPDVGLRVARWEREGASQQQIEAELALAKAEYEAHWANIGQRAGPLRKHERISGDVAERTSDLLAELLTGGAVKA